MFTAMTISVAFETTRRSRATAMSPSVPTAAWTRNPIPLSSLPSMTMPSRVATNFSLHLGSAMRPSQIAVSGRRVAVIMRTRIRSSARCATTSRRTFALCQSLYETPTRAVSKSNPRR